MYEVKVLADSISPAGVRLITVQATFPRFILAEVNTHRMLSRNSASSRAIPTEKLIERVEQEPFVPEKFNARVKGMGVGNELSEREQKLARHVWMNARDDALYRSRRLMEVSKDGVDKSRVNRLLEPFLWHTAIISATEWDNFFALRDHPAAQPEFQRIACMMLEAMQVSDPVAKDVGEWHAPLLDADADGDHVLSEDSYYWAKVSAGRCAKVSFDTHENYETPEESYKRTTEKLEAFGHLSPLEHPATVPESRLQKGYIGNFLGWAQLRKLIPGEENLVGAMALRPSWQHAEALQQWKEDQ
jgi:thymidylate synthase ThyX